MPTLEKIKEILAKKKELSMSELRNFIFETVKDVVAKKAEEAKQDILEDLDNIVENSIESLMDEKIKKQFKGDKGDKGDDGNDGKDGNDGDKGDNGYTPVKGKDYFTEREIKELKQEITPIKGKDYFDGNSGEKGKDADEEKIIEKVLSKIKLPDFEAIEKKIKQLKDNVKGAKKGGGMGNIIVETPTGAVNGSNTTFTLSQTPKTNSLILMWNGQFQRLTSEYTLSNKTITFITAPAGGEVYAWYIR